MSGQWRYQALPADPDIETPEAHWLRTELGIVDPWSISAKVNAGQAKELLNALSAPEVLGTEIQNRPLWLGKGDLKRLSEIASTKGSETSLTIELFANLNPSAGGLDAKEIAKLLDGASILSTGPAPEVPTVESADDLDDSFVPYKGKPVTVVIDDGIAIAHQRFRDDQGKSRVLFFLDMNGSVGASPGDVPHDIRENAPIADLTPNLAAAGRAWTKQQLDQIFDRFEDEEDIYRFMKLIDPRRLDRPERDGSKLLARHRQPLRYRLTHGTHVADLAAGFDPRTADEEELRQQIIAIQLPDAVVADRSDAYMAQTLKRALKWLGERLAALKAGNRGKPVRFVVNFSFGAHTGPNDGTGSIEYIIGEFIADHAASPCQFVLAAGNGLQARARAALELDRVSARCLAWRIQPDDHTSSFLQIWLPPNPEKKQEIEIGLRPPRLGPKGQAASRLGHMLDWVVDGKSLARIYHQAVDDKGIWRERVTIAVRPTGSVDLDEPTSPHGCWALNFTNIADRDLRFDARIQRDDPVPGARRTGRQSYFDHDSYVLFEEVSGELRNDETRESGPVRRQGTLSAYVTAPGTISVAGYQEADGQPARYSGSGIVDADEHARAGPGYAAVSETSAIHGGVLAAGTRTGTAALMNGTSVAAPQLTRKLVECGEPDIAVGGSHGDYGEARRTRIGKGRIAQNELRPQAKRIDRA